MKLIESKSQFMRFQAEMNKGKKAIIKKQVLLLSKIQQLLYDHFFMTDENIKLMDKDQHDLLPDYYSEPILEMKFPKGLSQNQLSEIGAKEHEDRIQLHYSEIEDQIKMMQRILDQK